MDNADSISNRQSRVSKEGRNKEKEIINILLSDEIIKNNFLIGTPKQVKQVLKNISDLYINYGMYKEMIDADICIVRKSDNKLVCVISVKKSFRERGAQSAYWAIKIKNSSKAYKYIIATPDVDKELYNEKNEDNKRKWRIILSFECSAVFVYGYEGKKYEDNNFFVGNEYLKEYIIKNFIQNQDINMRP